MNIMLIAVALIFLFCLLDGLKRGFIKIVASFAATLITIVVVIVLTPYVSDVLEKVLPVESFIESTCVEVLFPESQESENQLLEKLPTVELPREAQIGLVENSKLPEVFKELILENNNTEIYKALGVKTFGEYLLKYFAKLVVNVIAFLVTFLAITIVLRTIIYMLGIISDLPVIGGLNRLAGGALGMAKGVVIIWVIFTIVTLMYDSELGAKCLQWIEENQALKFLYDNNILMNYMVKFRG